LPAYKACWQFADCTADCTADSTADSTAGCVHALPLLAASRMVSMLKNALSMHVETFLKPAPERTERLKSPHLIINHLWHFQFSRVLYTLSYAVNQQVAFLPFCAL